MTVGLNTNKTLGSKTVAEGTTVYRTNDIAVAKRDNYGFNIAIYSPHGEPHVTVSFTI